MGCATSQELVNNDIYLTPEDLDEVATNIKGLMDIEKDTSTGHLSTVGDIRRYMIHTAKLMHKCNKVQVNKSKLFRFKVLELNKTQ